MDNSSAIDLWNKLLNQLEAENCSKQDQDSCFTQLEKLFKHIQPQAAKRHQIEIDSLTIKTNELLPKLFDNIDCADRKFFTNFLSMTLAYGYFRLAQITYYNAPTIIDPTDFNTVHMPLIVRSHWHDLEPLLPSAGEIRWKGVLNSGLVKEEKLLFPICLKLMAQKLHFYSIVMNLDQYQDQKIVCKSNGEKVAVKIIEIIRDVAFDDELYFMGMNGQLFNFLIPFIDNEQLVNFIGAIVEDLFKPYRCQNDSDQRYENEVSNLHQVVRDCILEDSNHQGILITSLINHLKCNLIRRKRRHSLDDENGTMKFEDIIATINDTKSETTELVNHVRDVKLTAKMLQNSYLKYWISVTQSILQTATLTPANTIKLFGTTTILLVSVTEFVDEVIINDLCNLITKILDVTLRIKYDKLFNSYKPQYIVELCKLLSEKTQLISHFNSPVQHILKSYIAKYLICSAVSKGNCDIKRMSCYIETICSGELGKRSSRVLQYIFVREVAHFIEMLKGKMNENMSNTIREWIQTCGEKMYKFIKRYIRLTKSHDGNTSQSEQDSCHEIDAEDTNGLYNSVAIHGLVCILKISMKLDNVAIVGKYGEILLRLFEDLTGRITNLTNVCKTGKSEPAVPLDHQLFKLLKLYVEHESVIKGYFNYELLDVLTKILMIEHGQVNASTVAPDGEKKKTLYTQIKAKLETIEETAGKNSNLYVTIINQQYSSATDDAIGSSIDMKREKVCCHDYVHQMQILNEITDILMERCDPKLYRDVFENIVKSMETCDPLNHPLIIYSFMILKSLCSRYKINPKPPQGMIDYFSTMLPRISCCLIRISKSVELGPSIHAFTNPGSHLTNRSAQCCTYSNCIQIYSHIFQRCPPSITNPLITDAFELIVSSNLNIYSKHSGVLHKYFSQLALATNKLLKSMSFGHKDEDTLTSSMPAFISILSNLIRCIIIASGLTTLENEAPMQLNGHSGDRVGLNDLDEFQGNLELLAIDVGRTLNNLSLLRVKMVEYAPHLISAYIKDCQKCACPGKVKIHLDVGIFRIFNLVDAHQKERHEDIIKKDQQRKTVAGKARGSLFEMIHARLDQASREVFRDLHDNYSQFHRYVGKL